MTIAACNETAIHNSEHLIFLFFYLLHPYSEFTEAESNLIDLSNEYDQYANADMDDGEYDEMPVEEDIEYEG